MEHDSLVAIIRAKLADGRLPHDSIPRVWGGAGNNDLVTRRGHVDGGALPVSDAPSSIPIRAGPFNVLSVYDGSRLSRSVP